VLVGCAAAAVLAVAVDLLLALVESGTATRQRGRVVAGAAGLAAVAALGWLPSAASGGRNYVVGAKTFAEQYVLAALIEDRLHANGLSAVRRDGLGSAVIFNALVAGDIDIYVEYTGTLWASEMHRSDVAPRAEVLAEVGQWLKEKYNVTMLGSLGFENAYALAMLSRRADALGVRTLSGLSLRAPQLSIAGDYEFFGRPEWRSIEDTYRLAFRAQRQMQPEFMYPAVAAGDVDVISAYTSDGRIAQFGLRTLEDDKHAIPPYDAIVLISPKRAGDPALIEAVRPLINAIPVAIMREANRRAGGAQTETPESIARWLWGEISKPK
jgi:osmoprotectant transport system permease protein